MARRTMAQRRRRAAEREQRRDILLVLLSRSDRGVITDAERPLLRAHVEAELRDADDVRRTVNGQQTVIQRQAAQLEAAHEAIEEAEREAGRALIRAATAEHQAATLTAELRPYRTAAAEHRRRIVAAGTIPAAHLTATELGRVSVAAHIAQHFPASTPEQQP